MLVLLIPMFSEATEDKFKVITTFTVIADIAQNIAGNAAIVQSITKPIKKPIVSRWVNLYLKIPIRDTWLFL